MMGTSHAPYACLLRRAKQQRCLFSKLKTIGVLELPPFPYSVSYSQLVHSQEISDSCEQHWEIELIFTSVYKGTAFRLFLGETPRWPINSKISESWLSSPVFKGPVEKVHVHLRPAYCLQQQTAIIGQEIESTVSHILNISEFHLKKVDLSLALND